MLCLTLFSLSGTTRSKLLPDPGTESISKIDGFFIFLIMTLLYRGRVGTRLVYNGCIISVARRGRQGCTMLDYVGYVLVGYETRGRVS